jgi:ribonuclease R
LGGEFFTYDETRHALIGSRSRTTYRLGDTVEVRLVEAAPVAGALRFELLSGADLSEKKPGKGRRAIADGGHGKRTRGNSETTFAPRGKPKRKTKSAARSKAKSGRQKGRKGQ